jgi:hypothetical protein
MHVFVHASPIYIYSQHQVMQGLINLFKNNVRGDDISGLAAACGPGMDVATLSATIERYNVDAAKGADAEFGEQRAGLEKQLAWLQQIARITDCIVTTVILLD